ncbi:M81 family metallopeptidase [Chitinophaga sp.]|uniref:M81 family metallopeptidase n=1 Tax=Chitinophaga sp. TaxID=1869181 RepID=UPI002614EE47|nr:M81 family metallopeptidase [uncultured Chitinophaga sp.]
MHQPSPTVFVSGFFHETHTFLRERTGLGAFRDLALHHGSEILSRNEGNGSPMDGFLSYAAAAGWKVIPGIQMAAMPSGMAEDAVFDYFREHFFAALEVHWQQIDAVYLVVHGAMVCESTPDVEGRLLEELQFFFSRRGKQVPVVAVLDLHANVSQKMIDNSTCLYGYRENPHTDAREAAVKAAAFLQEIWEQPGVRQVFHATPYIAPPAGQGSAADPMRALLRRAAAIEAANPHVLCINIWAGFAYADIPDCGFSFSCCTRGSAAEAATWLESLGQELETHLSSAYPYEHTLEAVLTLPGLQAPVLLIEASDNIGGGTPGDGTGILAPLLATTETGIVAVINDPEAVQDCIYVGIGATCTLAVGGKTDSFHGEPVAFTGTVINLTNGRFELENKNSHLASITGAFVNMGPCAVVQNRQATVLLTTFKTPPMDLGQLRSQGITPETAQFIIVKAAVSHKQAYDPIAGDAFYIDSPGLCTSNLLRLPYRHIGHKRIGPDATENSSTMQI